MPTALKMRRQEPLTSRDRLYSGGVPLLLGAPDIQIAELATANPDSGRLSNPYRSPMMIDAIHFRIYWTDASANHVSAVQTFGASVRSRFKLGRLDLAQDFIPIWNYGTVIQDGNITLGPEVSSALGIGIQGANMMQFQHFKWTLPQPLFVGNGDCLLTNLARAADGLGGTLKVNVAYACRRLPKGTPRPDEIAVPFVSRFIANDFGTTAKSVALSGAQDIFNPFDVPIHIQRFVGRLCRTTNDAGTFGRTVRDVAFNNPASLFQKDVLVKMQDSTGYNIIRDFVPFQVVFDQNRRAWTYNREMHADEWYSLQLQGMGTTNVDIPMISAVGWRAEALR